MTQQPQSHNMGTDPDEMSLKELILKVIAWYNYILSKKVIIFIACIIGGTLGLAYAFIKKPIYRAELTFALQGEKSGGALSGAMGLASQFGFDAGGSSSGEFSGDNLLELMKSRRVIEKTLLTSVTINGKRQTLAEYYINFNDIRDSWKDDPRLANTYFLPNANRLKFTLKQDSVLGVFYKGLIKNNISIDKLDKKLSIISLKVNSTNELFSKYFAEELVNVVSDFYIQGKTAKSAKNVAILQRQTDSVRRALYSGISSVASLVDAAPNPNPLIQSTLRAPSQRRQADVQANSTILSQLVTNLEMSKMSLLQETPLIQIIDTPILPLEKQQFGKLKGIVLGGVIGGILIIIIISLNMAFKSIMFEKND